MGNIVAVDIGGTHLRTALFSPNKVEPLAIQRSSTHVQGEVVFERLCSAIALVWGKDPVVAISVASAGPLDPEAGMILSAPNIPGWENFPLANQLSSHFKVPVFLGNDANLAALGEWRYGAGQGHDNILYLTISTGIGGGIINKGQLLLGHRGLAAELGHVTVLPDGPICSCGQKGHLEAISSGPSIARYVSEKIAEGTSSILSNKTTISARDIANAARNGDNLSQEAFARAGEYLGFALADFLHIFNPSIVILGGGVSQSGELLIKPARAALEDRVMNSNYTKDLCITQANLGDDAGLIGALVQAQLNL